MTYQPPSQSTIDTMLDQVRFDANGLIAALAQQHDTGENLMLAWMNREAFAETLTTGRVCYWSRSRNTLWRKGETSGQQQTLIEARLDCDGDAVLLLVHQKGVACHTGRRNCFYKSMTPNGLVNTTEPQISPETLYGA